MIVKGWIATEEVSAHEQATAEVTEEVAALSMREELSAMKAA